VSVALTSQPSSQKPEFTSGCAKDDGTASCTVGSVAATAPVSLNAEIAVASNATSVSSVKLTATAGIAGAAKWTPPAVTGTTSVTSAGGSSAKTKTSRSASATNLPPVPLGPIPNLNTEASLLIGAGNASELFPAITPSGQPSTSPAASPPAGSQGARPVANASTVAANAPVLTAQVAGLIALGLAIMLTVTRLSLRKRSGTRGTGS
jgi:hypothetical protein